MIEVGQWYVFDTRLYVETSKHQIEIGDKVEVVEVIGQWLIVRTPHDRRVRIHKGLLEEGRAHLCDRV